MLPALEAARTHEIMARYRPIAPKPELPPSPQALERRSVIATLHLRSRPCRTRKRSRTSVPPLLPPFKRQRMPQPPPRPLLPPFPPVTVTPQLCFSAANHTDAVTLSLMPVEEKVAPAPLPPPTILVERDLLGEMQRPKVIAPRAMRPVGSSISILGDITARPTPAYLKLTKAEEVEEEVESQPLPAVVSDTRNKVMLVNSAYKEMIGQPECPWLESMEVPPRKMPGSGRINGEVLLDLPRDSPVPEYGFTCKVNIEWRCNGRKTRASVPCDVTRLCCESKNYYLAWRFYINRAAETSCRAY